MASLVAMVICAGAIIAFTCSAAVGGAACLLPDAFFARLSPTARARLVLCAALLPAFVCGVITLTALSPWFGVLVEHCLRVEPDHGHVHLCGHHLGAWPAFPLALVGALLCARLGLGAVTLARALHTATRADHALHALARHARGVAILPLPAPAAFVLGVLRPTLYITRGLLQPEHRTHLGAVLAHERAHLQRRDALRMVGAQLALAFHLPLIANRLRRELHCAQEMAADASAARRLGSRERVARALVALSRAQLEVPAGAFAFGACHVEARVRDLLDDQPRREFPARSLVVSFVSLVLVLVATHAAGVHHGVEHLLGVLSH